ncbi:GGDEF domain-containing protein [Hymenobacter sp. RP-2-7]|uniref:diguanylate cyclase n=1 Tax=Hymenobacter polaris TaxID=2682546 RepID=A0A7Y0ADW8_9BACT|nr:GGDEF domain-containing protein [Hymenobacter polaris]NML65511.1 GGDEF domain-containing protein [Hymenobacter polaris]
MEIDNFTDELTGLKNYKALKEYVIDKIKESIHDKKVLSIILIDVDNFKNFNTTYGYNTADRVLKAVGELLGKDKRATDEVFRQFLKGDEFLVVASETSSDDALKAAERKRKLIENATFVIDEARYKLTVSCGVTEFKAGDDYTSFTNRAHSALVEAKSQQFKNCSKLFY